MSTQMVPGFAYRVMYYCQVFQVQIFVRHSLLGTPFMHTLLIMEIKHAL